MATSTDVRTIITNVANELGVDPKLALAIAQQESGFNPNAIGDSGNSVGLFQLNIMGEGAGMTVAQREDPETNARIALTQVAAVAKQHRKEQHHCPEAVDPHQPNVAAHGNRNDTSRSKMMNRMATR